jgi:hypothetical protein
MLFKLHHNYKCSPNLKVPSYISLFIEKKILNKVKKHYKTLSESSQTVIVVMAEEDERRGQGHTSASLLHQCAT